MKITQLKNLISALSVTGLLTAALTTPDTMLVPAAQAAAPNSVQAPFGLKWSMRPEEILHGMSCKKNHSLEQCRSLLVPKPLADAESYTLIFDEAHGLVKVLYVGKTIEKDPFGYQGQKRFDELRAGLTKKYAESPKQELIEMHKTIFIEPDEFYECLYYQGCGQYSWRVTPGFGVIELKLNGHYRGKGFITLEYESGRWNDALTRDKDSQAQHELDAL